MGSFKALFKSRSTFQFEISRYPPFTVAVCVTRFLAEHDELPDSCPSYHEIRKGSSGDIVGCERGDHAIGRDDATFRTGNAGDTDCIGSTGTETVEFFDDVVVERGARERIKVRLAFEAASLSVRER